MTALKKGWKDYMLAAMGALAPGHLQSPAGDFDPTQNVTTPADFDVPFGEHKHDNFLQAIGHLESSGGRNIAHKPSNDSLHQGSVAVGQFALMPKTIKNINSLLSNPQSSLMRNLGRHFKDEEFSKIASLPEDKMHKELKKNPKIEQRAARYLAEHLMPQGSGDPHRAAFKWRFGTNLKDSGITDKKLQDSGYVRKFKDLYKPEKPVTTDADPK